MTKRKISITECADTVTETLKKGVLLTTKAGCLKAARRDPQAILLDRNIGTYRFLW